MNIDQALGEIKYLLEQIDDTSNWADEIGHLVFGVENELRYLYEFAKTIREVPTTHDSKAEGDEWDLFFEEMKERARGLI